MSALALHLAAALKAADTAEDFLLVAWLDVMPRLDDFDGNNEFPRMVRDTFKAASALRRSSQELADWLNELTEKEAA